MRFTELALDLYTVRDVIRLPGLVLPLTTTIVRLARGGLVVISPLVGIEERRPEIEAKGRVEALVSASLQHHLGLRGAAEAFPQARVFALPGLEVKRPEVEIDHVLDDVAPPLWAGEIEQHIVRGLKATNTEIAFFHRATRTLILADLCFHINESEHRATRLIMRLNGAWRRFGPSRLMKSIIRDKAALRASVEHMLAWDPERIVVAHGDVVERGGRERLAAAFAFLS